MTGIHLSQTILCQFAGTGIHLDTTYLVEIVVLAYQRLQLGLDVQDLIRRQLELHQRDPSFLEQLQEPDF
jgi:hypothetical protein